jgi:hypothetical protein
MSPLRRAVKKENGGDSRNNHGVAVQMGSDVVGESVSTMAEMKQAKAEHGRMGTAPPRHNGAGSKLRRRGTIRRQRQRKAQQYVCVGIVGGLVLGSFLLLSRFRTQTTGEVETTPSSPGEAVRGYKVPTEDQLNSAQALLPFIGSGYERDAIAQSYEEQLQKQSFRWSNPTHLPLLPSDATGIDPIIEAMENARFRQKQKDFRVMLAKDIQPWENEPGADDNISVKWDPFLDYTKHTYEYTKLLDSPTDVPEGEYPFLQPLGELLDEWPQDDIDHPPSPIKDYLMLFDYSDPEQREAALRFRNAELPFKVYNFPELDAANDKWTDAYLSREFDSRASELKHKPSNGMCQQSENNYFPFFNSKHWSINTLGPAPTLDTDFSFALWSKHARYADKVGLPPDATHYYWQAGAPQEERNLPEKDWTMISSAFPSFSSLEPNFFSFKPEEQKGIQCRFGERGVTAATHYDTGRNMIAMITGAKRYILSPPSSCNKLGIVTARKHPSFRHSMLNFGHIHLLGDKFQHLTVGMSDQERQWLEVAREAPSLSTVLRQGEVLYVPSHWFHYITSLQKSAQCNVRSGFEKKGTKAFGGYDTVQQCMGDDENTPND